MFIEYFFCECSHFVAHIEAACDGATGVTSCSALAHRGNVHRRVGAGRLRLAQRSRCVASQSKRFCSELARTRAGTSVEFLANFERLVLGCLIADLCKQNLSDLTFFTWEAPKPTEN